MDLARSVPRSGPIGTFPCESVAHTKRLVPKSEPIGTFSLRERCSK